MSYILICDDLEDNCTYIQTLLEIEGYNAEFVTSGVEALNRIEVEEPDLLLLDVMMPGINGFEVVRRVRKNPSWESLPIILVTAYSELVALEVTSTQVNGVIHKPIDPELLIEKVQEFL